MYLGTIKEYVPLKDNQLGYRLFEYIISEQSDYCSVGLIEVCVQLHSMAQCRQPPGVVPGQEILIAFRS